MVDAAICHTYLERLQKALWEHDVEAGIRSPALVARSSVSAEADLFGLLLCPGLVQKVELCEYENRGLWWCWVEPSTAPLKPGGEAAPAEYERVCPADDISKATCQILAVLRPGGTAERRNRV